MYDAGDLKKGLKFQIDGEPYMVVDFQFKKPGKGQALYKCRLKNMISGIQFEKTYRSGEKFEEASLEEQEIEYLYADQNSYCFMNTANYEQEFLSKEQVGDAIALLKEYNNIPMPNQNLQSTEIKQYIQYFHWADSKILGVVNKGSK